MAFSVCVGSCVCVCMCVCVYAWCVLFRPVRSNVVVMTCDINTGLLADLKSLIFRNQRIKTQTHQKQVLILSEQIWHIVMRCIGLKTVLFFPPLPLMFWLCFTALC